MPPRPPVIAARVPIARTARAPSNDPPMTATLNGANRTPVASAEWPWAPCSASTHSSSGGVVDAVIAAAARFAPASPSARSSAAGSSGSAARASMRMKSARRATPATVPPAASGDPAPSICARVSPSTSSARPPVSVAAPAVSRLRPRAPSRVSGTTSGARANAATAIGTFTRNTHGHPACSVMTPPSSQPEAPPPAAAAVHTPSACRRRWPSGTTAVIVASAAGATAAAPSPWTARAATSTPALRLSPHARDAPAKSARPAMNTVRRPRRSASRPASTRNPANASVYALTTHCRSAGATSRLRWIAGSAIATIVASRTTTNWATHRRAIIAGMTRPYPY